MRFILGLIVLLLAGSFVTTLRASEATQSEPVVELPVEAQAAITKFVSTGALIQKDSDTKRLATRAKFSQALEALQATESKAGRLESALAVKALRDNVDADQVPNLSVALTAPGMPKGVVRPAESYQTELQKLDKDLTQKISTLKEQAVKDLEVVKIAETKAGRLEAAVVIKEQQDHLKNGQAPVRKVTAKALVFGKGSRLEPEDNDLLRRGNTSLTLEFVILSIAKDGSLFTCGGVRNGHSVAVTGGEVWYAIASDSGGVFKAPIGQAKPPYHFAVQYDKGSIQIWINGLLAKQATCQLAEIGTNGPGGGLGDPHGASNQGVMPRQGFEGELAAFRYSDKILYKAPFTPSYPLPTTDGVRLLIDAVAVEVGVVVEIKGPPKLIGTGELSVKISR